jgi:subtilisin family serine protease
MAKYRPDADIAGTHTDITGAATRYGCVNEATASDSEYVKSENDQTDSYFHVGLPDVTDPHSHGTHTLSVRSKVEIEGITAIAVTLKTGSTNIATWNLTKSTSWATQVLTLSASQVAAIIAAAYADLSIYVKFESLFSENSFVSWIEFETPDYPETGLELGGCF